MLMSKDILKFMKFHYTFYWFPNQYLRSKFLSYNDPYCYGVCIYTMKYGILNYLLVRHIPINHRNTEKDNDSGEAHGKNTTIEVFEIC